MIQNEQLKELIDKYQQGQCSDAEIALLESWYLQWNEAGRVTLSEDELTTARERSSIQLAPIIEVAPQKKLWPRIAGIAAAVIGLAVCVYFFTAPSQPDTTRHPELVSGSQDIAPGKNTAVLVLNGKQTQLSDAKAGIVVTDDIKYNDGTQVGSSALGMTDRDSRALEVITPKGGTYFIILQDGTKVWLNADSKLEVLPNFWNKVQRLVKLTGEAYFEVAKNTQRPFIVQSTGQNVTVLGTHFNISAYKGEVIKTTLLEGAVRIASLAPSGRGAAGGEGSVTLRPNQQSVVTENEKITVKPVNATDAISWKTGVFTYNATPLYEIMKQIERWYNVAVVYENPDVRTRILGGSALRSSNLSVILKTLESTGAVKFKVEGRKVTVSD